MEKMDSQVLEFFMLPEATTKWISEWQHKKFSRQRTLYFPFLEWTMLRRGSNGTALKKIANRLMIWCDFFPYFSLIFPLFFPYIFFDLYIYII